jgi:hypothetical protein
LCQLLSPLLLLFQELAVAEFEAQPVTSAFE